MAQAPSALVRTLDSRFDAIVQKAMQEDREDRHQSALEIRQALSEIQSTPHVRVNVEPATPGEERSAPRKKRPVIRVWPSKRFWPSSLFILSVVALGVIAIEIVVVVGKRPGGADGESSAPAAPLSTEKGEIAAAPPVSPFGDVIPVAGKPNGNAADINTTAQSTAKNGPRAAPGKIPFVDAASRLAPPSFSSTAIKAAFTNSCGMKFVEVPATDIMMCIHETRKKDYALFAAETRGVNERWKISERSGKPVNEGDDYPVTAVGWGDAKAFCDWLSNKEKRVYRLPTDREWNCAVGLGDFEESTKPGKSEKLGTKSMASYAWGEDWPPPRGAVNVADMSLKAVRPEISSYIEAYDDGFPFVSPVMKFRPNKLGIFDLDGNATEWCEGWYDAAKAFHFSRGASFESYRQDDLRTATRFKELQYVPESAGFRCVVEKS
jgi:formylglycine-generating enzyme required for sulfatase activity